MRLRILPLLLLAAAACHKDRSDVKVAFDQTKAAAVADEPLGPGDVRVTSTDGAFVLAVVGDTVRMQLSDSLRNEVSAKVAAAGDSGGIGGTIARSVSGIVGSAMAFVVSIPVREIEDVRYDDGRILFDTRGEKSHFRIGGRNVGDRDSHARFSPADGERFVAAVKARQSALR